MSSFSSDLTHKNKVGSRVDDVGDSGRQHGLAIDIGRACESSGHVDLLIRQNHALSPSCQYVYRERPPLVVS